MTHENEAQAAHWAVRLAERPVLDPQEQAALDTWLAEIPARAGALLRAEATLAYLDRGRVIDGVPVDDDGTAPSRRRLIGLALAGGGALAAGIALTVALDNSTRRFATAIGETRRIPLADGSVAALNTGSQMAVEMRIDRREVRIARGEAWFQVAHDTTRPFVVEAGEVRVRAVGTAFAVRRRSNGADVLVTQGVVAVWVEGAAIPAVRIPAGSGAFVPDAAGMPTVPAVTVMPKVIERALAWRQGELALDGETLAYAAREFNRYNRLQLHVDPRLGGEALVGYFRTNDPEGFAGTAARLVGGHVVRQEDQIVIVAGNGK